VVQAGQDVARNPRVGQCRGNDRCQAHGIERRRDIQGQPGGDEVDLKVKTLGVSDLDDLGDPLFFHDLSCHGDVVGQAAR